MYQESPLLIELLHRVLRDTLPSSADAAVLYSHTKENERAQLSVSAELYHQGVVKSLAVSGCDGVSGGQFAVSGFEGWKHSLIDNYGVPAEVIIPYDNSTDVPPSTDAEARGLVRFAKKNNWRSIIIVVPPLHAVRAFVSTVASAMREYQQLKIYSEPSKADSWAEEVVHSATAPKGRRADLITNEFAKMERYYAKGDHLSVQEVLEYLNWRDSQ